MNGLPRAVADWYGRRTWHTPAWTVDELLAAKAGRTVAVVLPALDEEATVGDVVRAFRPLCPAGPGERGLVDEIIVMDSGSTDRTAAVATEAGARVVPRESVVASVPVRAGKGEVMWRALAATSADIVVYADADLVDVDASLVIGLLGPLLTVPGVGFVKAFYDRPLRIGGAPDPDGGSRAGGGRVTELVARPLLALHAPELGGVIQPLGGEYAARRELLLDLPFAEGYGVEIGLLLDVLDTVGLDAIAQVDVGVRKHRHRDLLSLGVTATEILLAVHTRRGRPAGPGGPAGDRGAAVDLVQFERRPGSSWEHAVGGVRSRDRPPMRQVVDGVDVGPSAPC